MLQREPHQPRVHHLVADRRDHVVLVLEARRAGVHDDRDALGRLRRGAAAEVVGGVDEPRRRGDVACLLERVEVDAVLVEGRGVHRGRVHLHRSRPGDPRVGPRALDGRHLLLGEVVDRGAVLDRRGHGRVARQHLGAGGLCGPRGERRGDGLVAGRALESQDLGDARLRRRHGRVVARRFVVTCAPAARRARHPATLCAAARAVQPPDSTPGWKDGLGMLDPDRDEAAPLLGRAREQRLLTSLLDGIEQRGQTLVLRGEPGIGKSRLLVGRGGDGARPRDARAHGGGRALGSASAVCRAPSDVPSGTRACCGAAARPAGGARRRVRADGRDGARALPDRHGGARPRLRRRRRRPVAPRRRGRALARPPDRRGARVRCPAHRVRPGRPAGRRPRRLSVGARRCGAAGAALAGLDDTTAAALLDAAAPGLPSAARNRVLARGRREPAWRCSSCRRRSPSREAGSRCPAACR